MGWAPSIAHPVPVVLVSGQDRPRSCRRRPPRVRRPDVGGRRDSVHRLQSDVPRGAAVAEQPVALAAPQRGARCRCSPGTPCPRSRCRRCSCAGHGARDRDRTATPRRRRRPVRTSRCRIPDARSTRLRLAGSDSTVCAASSSLWSRCDHAADNPTSSPSAFAASDASAIECGNHACEVCAPFTFLPIRWFDQADYLKTLFSDNDDHYHSDRSRLSMCEPHFSAGKSVISNAMSAGLFGLLDDVAAHRAAGGGVGGRHRRRGRACDARRPRAS